MTGINLFRPSDLSPMDFYIISVYKKSVKDSVNWMAPSAALLSANHIVYKALERARAVK